MKEVNQETIDEIIATQDQAAAIRLLLLQKKEGIKGINPEDLIKLQFIRVNSLSPELFLQLLKSSMLISYKIENYLLSDKIESYVDQLDNVPDEIDFYTQLISVIENNQEIFSNDFEDGNKPFGFSVAEIIKDYNQFFPDVNSKDALNRIKFISSSKKINQLPEKTKKIVKDIIKVYDTAQSRKTEWDSIPEPLDEQEAKQMMGNFDLYQTFPDLAGDLLTESSAVRRETPEVISQKETRELSDFKIPLAKDIDLKTMPKRGLVFDQQTNVDVNSAAEENKEDEIQAKLEELKKRRGQ